MTAKVLESFGGKLAEQWVATLLTPAFVFWLGGFAAILQRRGWSELISTFKGYPEPLQLAILVIALCIIAASAFVIQRFDLTVLRFLEGYGPLWPHPLKRWRISKYRKLKAKYDTRRNDLREIETQQKAKFKTLESKITTQGGNTLTQAEKTAYRQLYEQILSSNQQEELLDLIKRLEEMPKANTDLMPTRLGNLLRTAEHKPLEKYGLDAVICWSRLWMLLPEAVKKDLQEARADLNTAARVWLWSLLFCGWTVVGWNFQSPWHTNLWTLWPLVGIFAAWFAYQWAIAAASLYGELIEAAFDLHRHLLYQSLRWNLPPDPTVEKRVGVDLTRYLRSGS